MFIFLCLGFLLTANTAIHSYQQPQRPISRPTPLPQPIQATPKAAVQPTFSQLQAQLEEMLSGSSEIGITVLRATATFYENVDTLLSPSQHTGEWKNYFVGGSGPGMVKNLSGRIQEANALISAIPPQATGGDALGQELRYTKAAGKYIGATKSLQETLKILGLSGQLPPITTIVSGDGSKVSIATAQGLPTASSAAGQGTSTVNMPQQTTAPGQAASLASNATPADADPDAT